MSYLLDPLPISSNTPSSDQSFAPTPRAGYQRRSSNKTTTTERRLPTSTSESALLIKALVTETTLDDVEALPKIHNKIKPFILRSTTSSSTTTTLGSIGSPPRCDQPNLKTMAKDRASLDGATESATTNHPVTTKIKSSNNNKGKFTGRPYFVPADPSETSSNAVPPKQPRKRSTSTASHASAKAILQAIDLQRPPAPNLPYSTCAISMHDLVASIGDLKSIAATIDDPDEREFLPDSNILVPSPNRRRLPTKPLRRPLSVQALSSAPLRSAPKPIVVIAQDDDLTSSINSLRGPAKSMTTVMIEKKKRYDNISRSTSRDKKPLRRRESPIAQGFAGEPMEYRSMQEMLEASGFKDTRVVSPVSKPKQANQTPDPSLGMPIPGPFSSSTSHSRGNNASPTLVEGLSAPSSQCFGSPSSLHPPLSKEHKASMLSLRGLFSLWKAEDEDLPSTPPLPFPGDRIPHHEAHSIAADSIEEADVLQQQEDPTLFKQRKAQFLIKTQAWVDEVAREAATLSISPAMLRASLQPKSFASIIAQEKEGDRGQEHSTMMTIQVLGGDSNRGEGSRMTKSHDGLVMSTSSNHYQSFGVAALGIEGAETTNQWLDIEAQVRDATIVDDEDPVFLGDRLPRLQYDDVVSEVDGESINGTVPQTFRHQRRIAQFYAVPPGSKNPNVFPPSIWRTLKAKASKAMLSLYTPPEPTFPIGGKAAEEARRSGAPKAIRKAVSTSALKPVLSTGMSLEGFDEGFDWDKARKRIQAVQRWP
ncbi:BQ2448_2412 [Microbotryum intermedium]|uniref:BQ2448_2412 protein n=1 Tax=Microbotryum intermedium TaxID=269621 RepID=A0A238F650_9BASI|nr:BQ2448_2412 [Microbotryum intermedium]